ncbi:hypothetical protein GQ55_7G316600 [Panicum hallii var. hallii]|uniref:Uncharacterized protein n=1 Tax=Panicum hallii var. hallii TaxID=1504633 RepID=A0A2T7D154_9POAL|nr:hypothetical protein GQ55_7G316600 [Panicum hallii var. hallii]
MPRPCFVSRCQLGIIGHRIFLRTFVSEPCSFLPPSLSAAFLPSFLSLKTPSNEDHAQHKRQAGPSPDPLCQSPNLPFSVLPTLSSPTLTPLPLSLLLLLSLSPSSLLPPTIPSPAF